MREFWGIGKMKIRLVLTALAVQFACAPLAERASAATVTITPIITAGQTAGDTGATFTGFDSFSVNDLGQFVFLGDTTDDADGNDEGVFFLNNPGGSAVRIFFEGDALPSPVDPLNVVSSGLSPRTAINNNGQIVTNLDTINVEGGPDDDGLVLTTASDPANFNVALTEGDPAPAGLGTFTSFTAGTTEERINESGAVAFGGSFTDTDGNFDSGLFIRNPDGTIAPVAIEGDLAGDTGQAIRFISDEHGFNDSGQIAFNASLTGGGDGVFIDDATGATQTVAVTGTTTVEVGGETLTFNDIDTDVGLNNAGQTVFAGSVTADSNGNEDGIFTGDGMGGVNVVAFQGDLAPLTTGPVDAAFSNFESNPEINDAGQIAFFAGVFAPSTSEFFEGIFLADGLGGLVTIALAGDMIVDALGTTQTISFFGANLEITNNGVGFQAFFNNGGSGLFFASFDDPSEIPLPAAAWIFLAGVGGLGALRRRGGRVNQQSL